MKNSLKKLFWLPVVSPLVLGCASAPVSNSGSDAALLQTDSTNSVMVPPGYGSLKQEEIAIRLEPPGIILRAIPLDEGIIRLLTPDSYRAMRELETSNSIKLGEIARRLGKQRLDLWYISLYGVQTDTRFTPTDLIITSAGRDFRPLEVIPLTAGFSEHRLTQRETQSALYVFDEEIDLNQPLTVSFQTERSDGWERILRLIESERVLVKARSSGQR